MRGVARDLVEIDGLRRAARFTQINTVVGVGKDPRVIQPFSAFGSAHFVFRQVIAVGGIFSSNCVVERAGVVNFCRSSLCADKIHSAIFRRDTAARRRGIIEVIHVSRSDQVEVPDTEPVDLLARAVHAGRRRVILKLPAVVIVILGLDDFDRRRVEIAFVKRVERELVGGGAA